VRWTHLSVVPVDGDPQQLFESLLEPARARRAPLGRAARPPLADEAIDVTRAAPRELAWALARILRWPIADFDAEGERLVLPEALDDVITDRFEGLGSAKDLRKPLSVRVRDEEARGVTLSFPSYSLGARAAGVLGVLLLAAVLFLFSGGHAGPPAGALLLGLLLVTSRVVIRCEPEGVTLDGTVVGLRAARPFRAPWRDLRDVSATSEG
jgi:hypothetical protein